MTTNPILLESGAIRHAYLRHLARNLKPMKPITAALGWLLLCTACPAEVFPAIPNPFRQGAEPVFVPSEMPGVLRNWNPDHAEPDCGLKKGKSFEAALVRVFNEDTQFSKEVAVFRFRDGTVRAWKSSFFSNADRKIMAEMKAKAPTAKPDSRKWTTELPKNFQEALKDGKANLLETQHFAFIWGNTPEPTAKEALKAPKFMEQAGQWFEKVWSFYEVDAQATMPYAQNPKPKRILVELYGTGLPGLGSGWADASKEIHMDPRAMCYGSTVIPHEFCHTIDAYTGGFMVRNSVGAWWETHAEHGSVSFSPTQAQSFPNMFECLHRGCQWTGSRYENWAIVMQLWEKKRTRNLVYDTWSLNKRDQNGASEEDPIETIVRIGKKTGALPNGQESWNDEIGEMAARLVTMDYINQGFMAAASSEARQKAISTVTKSTDHPGWFQCPQERLLYAYGTNWISLKKLGAASQITIDVLGESKDTKAQWQATIVAVDKNNVARYSKRVTAIGKSPARVSIDTRPGEDYILAIAATPSVYRPLNWDQIPEFTYPYWLKIDGGSFEKK
jgi:Family of unknown function (DUF6055)